MNTPLARPLRSLHRRLLPDNPDVGWTPYLWLVYLGFVYLPLMLGSYPPHQVAATVAATAVFLVLYFRGYWTRGLRVLPSLVGIATLGMILAPINFGASAFFIYAAAFACQLDHVRRAATAVGAIVVVVVAEWLILDLHIAFMLPAVVFSLLVGSTNIYYHELARRRRDLRLTHDEVRRLAATAERERIARDLHDLLGHSLSLITLKTELAQRLLDRDPERARREIEELEHISRNALAEVREAVAGYRSAEMASELANARLALEVSGIDFDYRQEGPALPPEIDQVLAMGLREAITNVVRHSNASRCSARIKNDGRRVELRITDDGRGGPIEEGSGLQGMRERLATVDGTLVIGSGEGTELRLRVPLSEPVSTDQSRVA